MKAFLITIIFFSINSFAQQRLVELVETGNAKQLAKVLEQGADPNFKTPKDGRPLLILAAIKTVLPNRLEVVKTLIHYGADVNIEANGTNKTWGYTALMGASNNGFLDIVKYLISNGADVNKMSSGECPVTSLWLAAYTGRLEVVKELVNNGADSQFVGGCLHKTPLEIAREYRRDDVVNFLENN